MRIAEFHYAGVVRTGIVHGHSVHGDSLRGTTVEAVEETLDELVQGARPKPTGLTLPLEDVRLLPPVTADCRGMLCVGINYVDHQQESAEAFSPTVPVDPIVFFKTPAALTGPHDRLLLDERVSREFDWEAELGVVIGRGGRDISRDHAWAHVFGYTVVNDITARDVQHRHKQWHLGKNVEASTPVGPWIVTADELGNPPRLDITLSVDGELMQSANTGDMIFDIAEQIATVSRYVTLRPGDLLATGTPAGVGFARTPARFLADGEVVHTAIEGIGELRNEVVTKTCSTRGLLGAGA